MCPSHPAELTAFVDRSASGTQLAEVLRAARAGGFAIIELGFDKPPPTPLAPKLQAFSSVPVFRRYWISSETLPCAITHYPAEELYARQHDLSRWWDQNHVVTFDEGAAYSDIAQQLVFGITGHDRKSCHPHVTLVSSRNFTRCDQDPTPAPTFGLPGLAP